MTKTEVFTRVANHLLRQKKQCIKDGKCMYRGPNNLKCAIGALIPDHKYKREFERGTVSNYPKVLKAAGLTLAQQPLAMALQRLHDDCMVWQWKDELLSIAKAFRIKLSPTLRKKLTT